MIDGEIYCIDRGSGDYILFIYRETGNTDYITHYACMLSDGEIRVLGYGASGRLGNEFDNTRNATEDEKAKLIAYLWDAGFWWNKANKKMIKKD